MPEANDQINAATDERGIFKWEKCGDFDYTPEDQMLKEYGPYSVTEHSQNYGYLG